MNNATSPVCNNNRGTPQGSIFGLLSFLIFLNNFPKNSHFFQFTLFADGSTLSCRFKNYSSEML